MTDHGDIALNLQASQAVRPDNLFKLTPELKDAITRHPGAGLTTRSRVAGSAAPPQAVPGRGSPGKRERWRCHHPDCDATFTAWAAAERHRHPSHCGGDVGNIELIL